MSLDRAWNPAYDTSPWPRRDPETAEPPLDEGQAAPDADEAPAGPGEPEDNDARHYGPDE